MPTIKKLSIATGLNVTAPTDLLLQTSTNHLETHVDDAAYVAANGSAVEGDIYLNTTLEAPRAYLAGAWRTGLMTSDAADATKTVGFDLTGSTTGTSQTLDFNSTASRVYTFPDYAGRVVIQTGTETDPVLFPAATGNIDIGNAASTTRIVGNLEVQGTSTTLNTVTLEVEDQNILINNGGTDVTAQGAGLTVERTGTSGSLIYDSAATTKWKAGNLGSEVEVVGTSSAQVITNKDIDGGTASNTSRHTVPKAAKTALDALTRKEGTILYGTDTKKHYTDDGLTLNEMGGGAGGAAGRNYLQAWYTGLNPISSVTGLTTTGNRTSNQTIWGASAVADFEAANNTTTPLRESGDIKLDSKTTTINAFVETPLFAIDLVDIGKAVVVSFDIAGNAADGNYDIVVIRYNSSGTYQETISVAGNASVGTPASAKLPTGTTTFKGFFIAGSTQSDLYAVRFRKILAVDDDFQIDSLFVGPQSLGAGASGTDWQSYTPIVSNITTSSVSGLWKQVGDTMIIQGSFTPNAVGSAPAILFSMPSGYTADSTKMAQPIGTTLAYIGSGMVFVTGTDYRPLSVSLSTSTALAFSDNRTSGLGPINGSDLGSGNTLTFVATIPIVGWTSNVTMADRAVEEYAANSSTTDADDTTSFANGVNGSQFGSFTAQRSKTVRFQTPRQKTDIFILEYSPDAALTWVNTAAGSGNISNYIRQNTATYGMRYIEGANATDMIVQFGAYRINDGSTFGAAGAAWSALASSNTHLWRLRKVSGGASVGFPVSARNIVGDTSGTVVPAGMIGEEIFATAGAPVALTNNAFATIASITLTPGTWDVSGFFVWQNTGTQATVNTGANAGISTAANSATGTIGGVNYAEIFGISPKSGYAGISLAIPPYRLVITSTSQRFLCGRFFADTAGSGNQAVGSIRAVRIA